ncbi:MAG TPA: M14 metallopeptidase family protein [Gemmatimonadales bacterium]|nr:M14 metallopeptidase family protein [Gemmatimonadales bacterium]
MVTHSRHWRRSVTGLAVLIVFSAPALAQIRVTSPQEHFGFSIGDDYHLATYTQFQAYWAKLDAESDRMIVQEIGKTAEGRPQLMAIITSPENHRNLARYKETSRRLALAEGLTDEQAMQLAREGKAVVWFDGGLHATEVLGAHQLIETVYRLVSQNDPETLRFLNDLIILAVHANPDGMELVSSWYMREPEPTKRSTSGVPRLYQKYIGHDNNRDFYMVAQPETENMARVLYHEWFPQILYNHHQTGPAGAVLFAPPFRDPFNYNFDPLVPIGIEAVGAAMHQRFISEGKPGAVMRSGASYSTWWNGGLRTTTYFHNMIGLLTETIGNPTPIEIPFVPDMTLPRNDVPFPIMPQRWHFKQSVEYSVTANKAVFDYASRHREQLLFNIYQMGRNAIQRGNQDTWRIQPKLVDAVKAAAERQGGGQATEGGFGPRRAPASLFTTMMRDPALRDPRGYIIPADQPDFPTAVKFVNTLVKNGITIHRATSSFSVGGKQYPAGSLVIKTAQAFRPHVLDMFEPQDHPNDFRYPGGPPIPPYDNAGWTLAYQMGVHFDRILDGFDGPFEKVQGLVKPPAGMVANAERAAGFLLSHEVNDAVVATNRLLAARHEVYWLTAPTQANGKTYPAGTIYIPARGAAGQMVRQLAADLGLNFDGVAATPGGGNMRIRPVRIGLWDRYGGSMPSGWTRWLLEQFQFPFEVVYPQALDAGKLATKYDVLVFPTGAIPSDDQRPQGGGFGGLGPDPMSIPAEFRGWLGAVTKDKTIPHLTQFLNEGGTIIAIGTSISMGRHAGLAVADHLVDASGKHLPEEKFYIPGSLLRVRVDNTRPIAWGVPQYVDVFFDDSPVMKLLPEAMQQGVQKVAWFDSDAPLRSGWAWGQQYLKDGVAMAEATVGKGRLYLFGPEILNRGQPHGTFKFFFNGIYLAGVRQAAPAAAGGGAR